LSTETTDRGLNALKIVGRGLAVVLAACVAMVLLTSCGAREEKTPQIKKLQVVTSLYPLYDFSRNIGQGRADVSLLLSPGLEAHSFEPKPGDMVRLHQANVFVYTNSAMEPWVQDVLKGVQNRDLKIIESGRGIAMISDHDRHGHGNEAGRRHDDGQDHGGPDPHIWLNFSNAAKMVDHILAGFIEKDPLNRAFYQGNADAYKAKLNDLDRQFKEGLSGCRKNVIVHGGHSAFDYLAQRYGLKYVAVSGFSPDAEPTPAGMIRISKTLKANDLNHLFYEELLSPRIAESIARETGASLLMLHGAHNISKEEFERGVSFLDLMQRNLQNLKRGLVCPQP
jgi:zinc transport system substrate-binding protein